MMQQFNDFFEKSPKRVKSVEKDAFVKLAATLTPEQLGHLVEMWGCFDYLIRNDIPKDAVPGIVGIATLHMGLQLDSETVKAIRALYDTMGDDLGADDVFRRAKAAEQLQRTQPAHRTLFDNQEDASWL